MFHCNWFRRTVRQFPSQTRVARVLCRSVESVQLLIRALPSLSHESKPFAWNSEKVLVIVKPNSLRLERKPRDRIIGHVYFLAVTL